MTARKIVPVILSGGSGTRLWPMSRPEMPKQMLALTANETMLQLTAGRAQGERYAAPIVVANARHADLVEQQLADAGATPQALILEPAGRNTAPAIALAAIAAGGGGDALLVMPSDHVIGDVAAFHAAIEAAMPLVAQGWLVTFGIAPDSPETGYGWIQIGDELKPGVNRVARFVEKPPLDKAQSMLASGDHAWNGGIFLFLADAYLEALAQFDPGILTATGSIPTRSPSPPRPTTRSITRSWKRPTGSPWCRSTWAGTTSAAGMRSTRSATPTATATHIAATATAPCSRSIPGTASSAATASAFRWSGSRI